MCRIPTARGYENECSQHVTRTIITEINSSALKKETKKLSLGMKRVNNYSEGKHGNSICLLLLIAAAVVVAMYGKLPDDSVGNRNRTWEL